MTMVSILLPVSALIVGLGLGAAYFAVLSRTVALHDRGASRAWIAGHYLARLAVAALVFWAMARLGALPLLLTLAGFLIARTIVLRRMRRDI